VPIIDPPYRRSPPEPEYRFTYTRPVRPPQPVATYALLATTAAVFVLELIVLALRPDLFDTIFTISLGWWTRPWQLVTSTLSHAGLSHIFFNGLFLYFLGPTIEGVLGRRRFLVFFFVTGAIAGVAQAHLPQVLTLLSGREFGGGAALGASGALMAVFGMSMILTPHAKMLIFPIFVPIPLWIAGILFAALDVLGVFHPAGIGNFAHLAGMAAGLVYGLEVKKELARRGLRIMTS